MTSQGVVSYPEETLATYIYIYMYMYTYTYTYMYYGSVSFVS